MKKRVFYLVETAAVIAGTTVIWNRVISEDEKLRLKKLVHEARGVGEVVISTLEDVLKQTQATHRREDEANRAWTELQWKDIGY